MAISPKHALIVGASSGIGLAVAHQVAPLVAKLTLCSRSCPTDLVASIKTKNPDVEVVHESLDMSLLHEVRKFTIKHAATTFNWIVLTAGMLMLGDCSETVEGLDVKMSTIYYGRFMLIHDLLPSLNRLEVRVLCVLAAGKASSAPDLDDLGVTRSYSLNRCAQATTLYLDLMAQAMSEHAPLASFMHIDPGFVRTNLLDNKHCAQIMAKALTTDEFAGGWKLLDKRAKELPKTKFHTDELKDAVWEHTLQTIDNVLKR